MNRSIAHTITLIILLTLSACDNKTPVSSNTSLATNITSSTASSMTSSATTDSWLGKWNGPEGTFIEISGGSGNYTIAIADLEGPKQFQGKSKGNQIMFERNGITEIIQASDGVGTGMKWLADKSNCLRVREGEGWCRE